jgi:hypothetical protein
VARRLEAGARRERPREHLRERGIRGAAPAPLLDVDPVVVPVVVVPAPPVPVAVVVVPVVPLVVVPLVVVPLVVVPLVVVPVAPAPPVPVPDTPDPHAATRTKARLERSVFASITWNLR